MTRDGYITAISELIEAAGRQISATEFGEMVDRLDIVTTETAMRYLPEVVKPVVVPGYTADPWQYANGASINSGPVVDHGPPCSSCGAARTDCKCGNIVHVEIPIEGPPRGICRGSA